MAMPRSSAAAITSSSRIEPPGWITQLAPWSITTSRPSRKGKKASLATAEPLSESPAWPALIEAMGAGNCALTLRTPENLEVIGNAGIAYSSVTDLTEKLQSVINDPSLIGEYRHRAMARVLELYNWEQITDQYEDLLAELAGLQQPLEAPATAESKSAKEREPLAYPIKTFVEEKPAEVRRTARTLP